MERKESYFKTAGFIFEITFYRVLELQDSQGIALITFSAFWQGRGIETNLYAQFKCDSLKIGMVII